MSFDANRLDSPYGQPLTLKFLKIGFKLRVQRNLQIGCHYAIRTSLKCKALKQGVSVLSHDDSGRERYGRMNGKGGTDIGTGVLISMNYNPYKIKIMNHVQSQAGSG